MQKINALPDVNRMDVTPDVVIGTHDVGGDVRYSDVDRNTALPDENQSTVLPRVQIGTGDPNQPNGRTIIINKRGDTGGIKMEEFPNVSTGPQYKNVPTSMEYLDDNTSGYPTGYVGQ